MKSFFKLSYTILKTTLTRSHRGQELIRRRELRCEFFKVEDDALPRFVGRSYGCSQLQNANAEFLGKSWAEVVAKIPAAGVDAAQDSPLRTDGFGERISLAGVLLPEGSQ